MEGLRCGFEDETSFSHEVLRFLFRFAPPVVPVFERSGSSSDEAKTSESGVERRRSGFDLSRICGANVPKAGIGPRGVKPVLEGVFDMVSVESMTIPER
jgi:hypothetical protein